MSADEASPEAVRRAAEFYERGVLSLALLWDELASALAPQAVSNALNRLPARLQDGLRRAYRARPRALRSEERDDEVRRAITQRTRMMLINTPNNPTASVLSAEDLRVLESMLRETDIVVVSDEVYEHIVYDGHRHQSVACFPGLAERSFVVSSFGKTYHITGWKTGYVMAPRELMAEFRKVHQFNAFVTNGPVQHALAEYMKNREAYLSLAAFYQRKRDLFLEGVSASRFVPLPSRGTFFQNLRYDAISDERDTDLAIRLTRERGIASIPVSVFYREPPAHKVLRFCFAKSDETLARGAEILCRL